ncbi:MAG: winged helix-turn-helix transcriptional regulator [Nitrososphaerales archaeon]
MHSFSKTKRDGKNGLIRRKVLHSTPLRAEDYLTEKGHAAKSILDQNAELS